MTDYTHLAIAFGHALEAAVDADLNAEAADAGHDLPGTAAAYERDAAVRLACLAHELLSIATEYRRRAGTHEQQQLFENAGVR